MSHLFTLSTWQKCNLTGRPQNLPNALKGAMRRFLSQAEWTEAFLILPTRDKIGSRPKPEHVIINLNIVLQLQRS